MLAYTQLSWSAVELRQVRLRWELLVVHSHMHIELHSLLFP